MESLKKFSSFNPAKGAFTLLDEFKSFAFKGNVIDLAVGVIIGASFGKIIDSLVKNIIMPVIGLLFPGQQGYLGWKFVVNGKDIPYGLFLGEVVNFIVVSAALFIFLVKFLSFVMKAKKAEAAAPPSQQVLTKEEELLTEIRDLFEGPVGLKMFFGYPAVWLFITLLLLAACTFLPIRIKNDELRSFVMRWVLVPVSIVIIVYVYPVGIEVFRKLALK